MVIADLHAVPVWKESTGSLTLIPRTARTELLRATSMAYSDEWEDEHLTKSGRVGRNYKHDYARGKMRPVPADAVLTAWRHVYVGAMGAAPSVDVSETALSSDVELIMELRKTFGEPTFAC